MVRRTADHRLSRSRKRAVPDHRTDRLPRRPTSGAVSGSVAQTSGGSSSTGRKAWLPARDPTNSPTGGPTRRRRQVTSTRASTQRWPLCGHRPPDPRRQL